AEVSAGNAFPVALDGECARLLDAAHSAGTEVDTGKQAAVKARVRRSVGTQACHAEVLVGGDCQVWAALPVDRHGCDAARPLIGDHAIPLPAGEGAVERSV